MNEDPRTSARRTRATRKDSRCLGPVSDLRKHLHPEWWRSLFGRFYLETDGDVVSDEILTRSEVERICELLQPKEWEEILDVCCGHGRHSLELARRGYRNVHGLDRSRYLIRKARARAEQEGLSVKFREGDARKLPYSPDSFDIVLLLGNSFGYFESTADDLLVLKEILRVLKPHGRFLLDVADGQFLAEHYEQRSWEWIDQKLFVCRERMLDSQENRLICREVITDVRKGVLVDQVYAERLYTGEQLEALLRQAGFSDVTVHESRETESGRNQDLGMMARRLLVTAVARKEWTSRRSRKKALRHVAVILGDPRRSDIVKPNRFFDEDDIRTINQLKAALAEIKDRKFYFLDNHDKLIQDLIRLKGTIDYAFNLCDEGYRNDPFKELHIPALLEMLDIPYTGAPPQCLAICYDKSVIRGLAADMGIPVASGYLLPADAMEIEIAGPYPLIIKPNFGDSSFGIWSDSVVEDEESLMNIIQRVRTEFGYDKPILIEEFLPGKDLTIGIIGQPDGAYQVLPITEEDYSALPPGLPRICGYEAKWLPDSPYWKIKTVPADLPTEVAEKIVEWSLLLAHRIGACDYVRFDWRLDSEGQPRLLEANPNPGWCWDGHLAKAAALAGMSYADMLRAILDAVEKRIESNGRSIEQAPFQELDPSSVAADVGKRLRKSG